MNRTNNSLHSATEKRIRDALYFFADEEKTPTVSGICERAEINRATFYRHYKDVPDLMEKTRAGILNELLDNFPVSFSEDDYISRESLVLLTRHMERNRAFFRMYLGMPELPSAGRDRIWESFFIPLFRSHGVKNEAHMKYYYCFYISGFLSVLRRWIESGTESPEEIADILWRYTDRMTEHEGPAV